jgi:hypothetical protein
LGSFLQALAQFFELLRLQAGLAPSPARLFQTAFAPVLPVLMPAPAGFARNSGSARHLGLAKSLLKELGGLEAALFQRREIPFDTSRIAHAQTIAWSQPMSLYYANINKCV